MPSGDNTKPDLSEMRSRVFIFSLGLGQDLKHLIGLSNKDNVVN